MAVDTVGLLKRYHDALNRYEAEAASTFFAPDAVYVSPGVDGRIEGRENIIAAFSAYFAEHPDQHATDDWIEEVEPGVARVGWRLQATSKSTGQPYVRTGTETIRFDAIGLIVHVTVEDT